MKKQQDNQTEKLTLELEEYKKKYLRALADYQNLEKRVRTERSEEVRYAAKNLILKILGILDILEQANKTLNDQGLHLAIKQFQEILKNEQVERIESLGKRFDPETMECVEVALSDKDGVVLDELRPGFTMFGKVIRVVRVKVGKKELNEKKEELAKQELQKGDYM